MDRGKFARFLEEEEALRKDPEYQALKAVQPITAAPSNRVTPYGLNIPPG